MELPLRREYEPALPVRMAEKHGLSCEASERWQRLAWPENVFVFVQGRAVRDLKSVQREGSGRQGAEKLPMFWGELLARPKDRLACERIEVLYIHDASTRLIMIAADDDCGQLPDSFDDFVWIGTVSDQIAKADGAIIAAARHLECLLERFQIRVNVTDNQVAQSECIIARQLQTVPSRLSGLAAQKSDSF